MRKSLHVVVGHPYSDIGKGWIASAVGASLGKSTPVIKIDPMLSPHFPHELGILVDDVIVTDDAATYASRGLEFSPNMNIVMGDWMARALQHPALNQGVLSNEAPKITYSDLAFRLASDICLLIKHQNAVIEVGGCPDDKESSLPADAVRVLMSTYDYQVYLHVVSAYDFTTSKERGHDVKTRMPVRAIETAMQVYWGVPLVNLKAYVRRANTPDDVTDEQLRAATAKVAFKTGMRPNQVVYIPNLSHPKELDAHIS